MRFLPRLVILAALGIATFLSWRLLLQSTAVNQGTRSPRKEAYYLMSVYSAQVVQQDGAVTLLRTHIWKERSGKSPNTLNIRVMHPRCISLKCTRKGTFFFS
ncbi:hypothetical protein AV530_018667 [Patagioenas fasciata monilis]|uniref:Uncharacterized protein n=1 Tax=Patagioenas fasciata monilis TaxID=372326 RepID=A0A1V4JJH8_PATFA|nr:hypothetical protein AV530_018667 [Patagioenas fasciata monilis]